LILASSNFFRTWYDWGSGIELVGEFPLESHTLIFNNQFFLGTGPATAGFASGIYARAGTKNNVSIFGNEFTGNHTPYIVHQAIALQGASAGESNHFVNNTLDRSEGQVSLMLRFSQGFENTQVCGNYSDNVTHRDYLMFGMNSGTDFSKNTMDFNGGLIIQSGGLIGPQLHRGNKFFNAQAGPFVYLAFAECQDEDDGISNLFTIHTQRSNLNNNFFSEYHPEVVTPAPDGEFFFVDDGGSPFEGDCDFDFLNFNEDDEETAFFLPMDGMVASNGIFIHPENLSGQYRLNRYLFKKLKNHPELAGMDNSFPSFLSALQGTNLDKLYQVERDIDWAIKASEAQEEASESMLAEIRQNIDSLDFIDSLLQSADFGTEAWNSLAAQKNAVSSLIVTWTEQYDGLVADYIHERNQKLNLAQALNASISSTATWENYEKTVNDIRIDKLLYGSLTESQIDTLSDIAVLCPEVAGYAASIAQGLLPDCVLQELTLCEGGDLEEETEVSLPQALTLPPNNATVSGSSSLFPNPVTGSEFSISVESPCKIYVQDVSGRVMLTAEIHEKKTNIRHGLGNGLYFVTIIGEGGQKTVKKMVVQKQ
jgi:Secretion system C-terminal sorting domain